MQVTPVGKKFGRYAPGDAFALKDAVAKVFIKKGRLAEANAPVKSQGYVTRDMRPAAPVSYAAPQTVAEEPQDAHAAEESVEEAAPYGYKADGTPRKRPGRPAASE
jgi:hypothetical protein